MADLMYQIVDFVNRTRFTDLPKAVVHETKRVLLDSIGCALLGHSSGRGKISVQLAKRLGGPPESTIIGKSDRVSSPYAAFANGELINAFDYDAMIGWHLPPIIVPAPLALAESTKASGKELILATALGFEIARRLEKALGPSRDVVPDETAPDKIRVENALVFGNSSSIFGVIAASGKILGLNQEKMANAMGIGGYISLPSTVAKWRVTTPVKMVKYGSLGWTGNAGITATLLADMGYLGDTDVFEGEFGFWRYAAARKWEPEAMLKGLGTEWQCLEASYKRFPCGF
jgi:2-methylcitrate dehydratase PrpD